MLFSIVSPLLLCTLFVRSSSAPWTHDWSSGAVMLWADFSSPTLMTPNEVSFIANNYAIVSLEKCFGQADGYTTEDAFILSATELKGSNPQVKVLFYWNAMVDISGPAFKPCYAAGAYFVAHPELWAYDDFGNVIMNGPFYLHNMTVADTERYMVSVPLGVQARNASLFDGIFADSALASPYANLSQPSDDALNAAINEVSLAQSLALNAAAPGWQPSGLGVQVIGNGLAQYHAANPAFPADDGMGMVPFMDGVCVEHFAAFEMTNSTNCSLIPSMMQEMLGHIAATAALNKTVLIKGWPGPVNTPIVELGPTWPASCGADAGETRIARAANALTFFTPSYALFLLAVEPTVYWSYSWWYTIQDGYYPPENAADANTTSAPLGWYPDLSRPIGAPLGPAAQIEGGSGWIYTRSFEHAVVTIDLANYQAAKITYSA